MNSESANLPKTAQLLIKAVNVAQRRALIKSVRANDFPALAQAVKEVCYSFWTSQPTVARSSAQVLRMIYKLSPQAEIRAYLEWITGIAAITRGKLAAAIVNLDAAAAIFTDLKKEYEAAQTQIAKLYALSLLGRRDEAVECGEKILRVFERFGDETAAGKVEKNLGNIVSRHELHELAEKFYLSAQKRFSRLADLEELTMVENGLAITYSAVNDFRRAEKFYAQALRRAQAAEMLLTEAEIEASMGSLALFRGKLDAALKYLELSRRKYETLEMPHQTAIAELEIADAYLELNLLDEALAIYETVAEKFKRLKMRGEEARARANFGRVAAAKNDLPTARKQLKTAARLYLTANNRSGAAAVEIAQANLELGQRNYRKSLLIYDEIERLLSDSVNWRLKLSARFIKAEALRNTGEAETAEKELEAIYAESVKHEQSNIAQAAQLSLGKIAVARRDFKSAERHFKKAIRLIENVRAPLAAEEFRMAFLADKLAPYECLAKIYLAQNKPGKALMMLERARARSLSEDISENPAATETTPTAENLQKRLADSREELNWFYSRLTRAAESEIGRLQAEASRLEKEIAVLQRQISSTNSHRAELNSPTAKSDVRRFKELRQSLGKRRALIEFVVFGGVFSAFVVTDRRIRYFGDLAREADITARLESLHFQFGALRYGASNIGNYSAELKNRADFYLGELYKKLFAPLERAVGGRDVIIVPVGAAHYVPFHALFDGRRYLIETREIVHAPSATVRQFLASKPRGKSGSALLIGYADERIPLVDREIEDLRGIFSESESFTGERATVAAFTGNAARFDVLHLACHGQFRPESPLFSSLHLADGWLTVRDIAAQKLKAELVTLSACETGIHKIFAGEEILGLARGFLSAGAKSMLLSLWTVSDETTTELMRLFYERRQAGRTTAQALQAAQRVFIERGVHPYFWSAFYLIGK